MMRICTILVGMALCVLISGTTLAQVKMEPKPPYDANIRTPKVADGSMDEWSPLGGPEGHGTADNEWYFYDSGKSFWHVPQGGKYDQPLSPLVVEPHPWYGVPMPVASGFNMWGFYLCYDPFLDGHSITVALDLPCSSNMEVSPEYFHPYSGLPPMYKFFYPVAFDCDGNGNPNTVNSYDYYPHSENGFNYIKPVGVVFDDGDQEKYQVVLYLGDDKFPTAPPNPLGPGGTDGLIIKIELTSEFGVVLPPIAEIPGPQTKSGMDLDLVATYGTNVLQVGGHENPDPLPSASPRIVDIEVKLNQLKTIIEDPTHIDWSKVGIGKINVYDLNKIYVSVKSGSLDDKSDVQLLQGGYVFPAYPCIKTK